MGPALIGLIGVIIGGLLSGGTSYYLDRRKERADLRAALREVLAGLHDNASRAQLANNWWNKSGGASDDSVVVIVHWLKGMTSDSWPGNQDVLAKRLSSNEDWIKINAAFHSADLVRTIGERVDEKNTLTADGMTEVAARISDLQEGFRVALRLLGLPQELQRP